MSERPSPCPNCSAPLEQDYVDVGVGSIPIPPHCIECGWSEDLSDAALGLLPFEDDGEVPF